MEISKGFMKEKRKWWRWVIVGVGLVMAVRQGVSVVRLWKTGRVVEEAKTQVEKESRENERLKEKLAEVSSPEFVEREAREKLGYGKAGETLLVLPNQNSAQNAEKSAQDKEDPNWRKWWRLYVGE